uniref:Uncharacterized protein n=1 Tax=Candidatus Kentrum sp. LPFa TaxID=2126335 RepID=A0A450XRW9_9GAMM|nr:MAG: hypothetical protein BECKLPF1236C_GA0070990_101556 [Candidatus Kentron sp. LPFa]
MPASLLLAGRVPLGAMPNKRGDTIEGIGKKILGTKLVTFPENPEQNDQKIRETQEVISLIELFGSRFSGLGCRVDRSAHLPFMMVDARSDLPPAFAP